MERNSPQICIPSLLFPFLFLSHMLSSQAQSVPGTIQRTKNQILLASLQANIESTTATSPTSIPSQLFLTSLSGNSAAYLVRHQSSVALESLGQDYCYIQVQEGDAMVWKSPCAPISQVSTCNLLFTDYGLELYDGISQSSWKSKTRGGRPRTLLLLDAGTLQIRDQSGRILWVSSERQGADQSCLPFGTPEENSAFSPFANPTCYDGQTSSSSSSSSSPGQSLDQQEEMNYPQQQTLYRPGFSGFSQPFSSANQPFSTGNNQEGLVGNDPFNGGVSKRSMMGVLLASFMIVLGYLQFPM